jgi:hypothetical protein
MKKIKRLVLVVVALLVLGASTGLLYIDRIARLAVEAGATYALGVKTKLGGMDVGVLTGSVALSRLHIANPQGFDTPHFMDLSRGSVAVSLGSLMGDTVTLPELTLGGLDLNLERKGTSSNYKVILDELKKFETKADGAAAGSSPTPGSDPSERGGRTYVVKQVAIDGVKVQVNLLPVGGELSRVPIVIPRIELRDVGTGPDGGVEMGKLVGIVMRAVLDAVVREGGGLIPGDIAGELRAGIDSLDNLGGVPAKVIGDVTTVVDGQVRKLGELSADTLKKIGSGAGNLGEGVKDAGKKITDGIGGLIKKDNEKEEKRP